MQNSPRNNTETVRAEVPDVISLYELAEQRDIDVYWYSMDSDLESLVAEIVPTFHHATNENAELPPQEDEE